MSERSISAPRRQVVAHPHEPQSVVVVGHVTSIHASLKHPSTHVVSAAVSIVFSALTSLVGRPVNKKPRKAADGHRRQHAQLLAAYLQPQ